MFPEKLPCNPLTWSSRFKSIVAKSLTFRPEVPSCSRGPLQMSGEISAVRSTMKYSRIRYFSALSVVEIFSGVFSVFSSFKFFWFFSRLPRPRLAKREYQVKSCENHWKECDTLPAEEDSTCLYLFVGRSTENAFLNLQHSTFACRALNDEGIKKSKTAGRMKHWMPTL